MNHAKSRPPKEASFPSAGGIQESRHIHNGDAERLVEEQKIVEKQLYPLRIDHRTVIYVSKEKCTPEYAEMKRRKMNPALEPAVQKEK